MSVVPKRPKKAKKELVDLVVNEISVVDVPANLQEWVVLKRHEPTMTVEEFCFGGLLEDIEMARKAQPKPKQTEEDDVKTDETPAPDPDKKKTPTPEEKDDSDEPDETTEEVPVEKDDSDESGEPTEKKEEEEEADEDDPASDDDDPTEPTDETDDKDDTASTTDLLTIEKMEVFKGALVVDSDGDMDVILKVGAKMKQTRLSLLKKIQGQLTKVISELEGTVQKAVETPAEMDVDSLADSLAAKIEGKLSGKVEDVSKQIETTATETQKRLDEMDGKIESLGETRTTGNSEDDDETKPVHKDTGDENVWDGLALD